ncbi:MAG: hypothetical protein WB764_16745 [Xanthobacteraceae bacterium]
MTQHYDVIIIGSGPGGASVACRLAPTGERILLIASFFPSIGAVNPTLTIIANALLVADRIKERLK